MASTYTHSSTSRNKLSSTSTSTTSASSTLAPSTTTLSWSTSTMSSSKTITSLSPKPWVHTSNYSICSVYDKFLTKTTIQTTCLHWRNSSKWNNVGAGANNTSKATKTIMIKQAINDVSGSPGGSWWTKVPTRLCYPFGHAQQSYWQGLAPSSLAEKKLYWRGNLELWD